MITETLHRNEQPPFREIESIQIQELQKEMLPNGIPLYLIQAGYYDIVRVDFIFPAGTSLNPDPLVPQVTNSMLTEGTQRYSSSEIARQLDYYGAFVQPVVEADMAGLVVYTLAKYAEPVLRLIEEVIKRPSFPQKELDIHLAKRKQQFLIEQEKVNTLARQRFFEVLFGEHHPYGRQVKVAHYDRLVRDQLMDFGLCTYRSNGCTIMVSGKFSPSLPPLLYVLFGQDDWLSGRSIRKDNPAFQPTPERKFHITKANALQSAIRIGRTMVSKTHPDYPGLMVLNTILGGYFGSRLMKNIREEKGYTYGIGSFILSMHNAGYFAIVSETGTDVTRAAITEIYKEMDHLCQSPVPEDELKVVKNYLMGELVREFDGPFALAESYKSILEYGLTKDYFNTLIHTVRTIDPGELQRLARQYLRVDSMYEVVAGN
jgi:zinc protease